jgi:hypothetical protein
MTVESNDKAIMEDETLESRYRGWGRKKEGSGGQFCGPFQSTVVR